MDPVTKKDEKGVGANFYRIHYQIVTNYAKPGLISMIFRSFSYYRKQDPKTMKFYLNPYFYLMDCTSWDQKKCNSEPNGQMSIDQLLDSYNSKSVLIAEAIGNSAFGKITNKLKYLMED